MIILIYLAHLQLCLGYCTQFWDPQYSTDLDKSVSSVAGHCDGQSVEHLPYEERLRELGWFSLQKRQFQSDQRNRARLLTEVYAGQHEIMTQTETGEVSSGQDIKKHHYEDN